MKKYIVRLTLAGILLMNIAALSMAQLPKADKDTVNADKAAKPVFYQATEEENSSKGNNSTLIGVVVGVIVAGGIVLLRRKKKQ